jgi:hypothetical protein
MEVGLLWYDNDPRRALEDKIGLAVRRYRERYGRWPNICYVHPTALNKSTDVVMGGVEGASTIRVVSAANILLHHLWLGEWAGEPVKGQPSSGDWGLA